MQLFNNLSIGKKFFSIIILFTGCFAIVGLFGYHYTHQSNNALQSTYENSLLPIEDLSLSITNIRSLQADLLELTVTTDAKREAALVQDMQARTEQNRDLMKRYEASVQNEYEKKNLDMINEELGQWREKRQVVVDLARQGQKQAAYDYYTQNLASHATKLNQLFDDSIAFKIKEADDIKQFNEAKADAADIGLLLVPLLAVLLGSGAMYGLTRNLIRRIGILLRSLHEISEGNLGSKAIEDTSHDEIGELAKGLEKMRSSVQQLVQKIAQSSEQVAAASEELTASAQQSAEAAGQVAGSVTEISQEANAQAASANQIMDLAQAMAAQAGRISQAAAGLASIAADTSGAADRGLEVVNQTVGTMTTVGSNNLQMQETIAELSSSSQQINEMVELISSIAGQTNLLALNAAIEAARAGEQGRGFAVVAEEVRKLAEASDAAVQKIGKLVGKNQMNLERVVAVGQEGNSGIQSGILLVNDTGATFKNIAEAVVSLSRQTKDISGSIHKIAEENKQLVVSVKEINKTSKESAAEAQSVSAATQEQSASMEEIASSSHGLATLANDLQAEVARFRL